MHNKTLGKINFIKSQQKRVHEIHADNLLKIYSKKPGSKLKEFYKDFCYGEGIKKLKVKKRKKEVFITNKRINRQNKILLSRIKNIENRKGIIVF